MVSDLNIIAQKWSKIAAAKKVFILRFVKESVFLGLSQGFPGVLLEFFPRGFTGVFTWSSRVFQGFSQGFHMVFPRFSRDLFI